MTTNMSTLWRLIDGLVFGAGAAIVWAIATYFGWV